MSLSVFCSGILSIFYEYLAPVYRPGGRIHSCWLGDVVTELGAQHIEGGCATNAIYNLACQEGLLNAAEVPRDGGLRGLFCRSDGRAIDTATSLLAYQAFRQIEQQAKKLYQLSESYGQTSLLDFVGMRIQQELLTFPEEMRHDASRVMYGLTNNLRTRCGDDLSQVNANQFGSFIQMPCGRVRVPLGYIGVVAPLLRELPPCCLHYCKPVNKISWGAVESNGRRAIVHCCDGDSFPADYVIVTVSLGVLKQHADRLFCPQLPSEKVEAICALGYGMVNKVFMEYSRPFWVWRKGRIRFAWSQEELSNRCDWTRGINGVDEVDGSKHVLYAFASGPEAVQMELASDEEIAHKLTKLLRQFTGDSTLPYPCTILRSKWVTDPYFCGAYSYLSINSTVGHQCELAAPIPGPCEPVAPILFFAGEATCVGHYATVHGARISGIREAERIISLTKKFAGPPKPLTCSSS